MRKELTDFFQRKVNETTFLNDEMEIFRFI